LTTQNLGALPATMPLLSRTIYGLIELTLNKSDFYIAYIY